MKEVTIQNVIPIDLVQAGKTEIIELGGLNKRYLLHSSGDQCARNVVSGEGTLHSFYVLIVSPHWKERKRERVRTTSVWFLLTKPLIPFYGFHSY